MTQQQADEILHARMSAMGRWLDTGERADVLMKADPTLAKPEAWNLAQEFGMSPKEAF